MIGRGLPLVALFAPFAAVAAPPLIPVTGYLTDSSGAPVNDQVTVDVRLYATSSGSSFLWEEIQQVNVDNGQFTAYLGQQVPLDLQLFRDQPALYLGLTVGSGAEMTPRFEVATAPYAAYARYCDDAATVGGIDPANLQQSGDAVAWTDLTGVPADLADGDQDTTYTAGTGLSLTSGQFSADQTAIEGWARSVAYDTVTELRGDLDTVYAAKKSCTAGQLLVADASGGWACTDPTALPVSEAAVDAAVANNGYALASDVTTLAGRVSATESAITSLQTADTALAGRVSATESAITSLQTADTALAGRVSATESAITSLQTADAAINGKISVLQSNNSASTAPPCGTGNEGQIYYDTTKHRFYGCNGTAWRPLDSVGNTNIIATGFTYSVDSITGGAAGNVADAYNITSTGVWPTYCVQTNGANGVHWLKVDFGGQRYVTAFSVFGYPGGSHQPTGAWNLQGSNDDTSWTTVSTEAPTDWPADASGSYPPRNQYILPVQTPGNYRYYRVYGNGWTNGYMLMCNLSMYEN